MEKIGNVGCIAKPCKMASFDAESLTDSELRKKLAEYGYAVGPVTETTRKILIKKLKLLVKQKNSLKNANRSLAAFSSGDESGSDTDQNGGKRKPKRVSMPPPSSCRTKKGKSSSPNFTPDISPVLSSRKLSCSTPLSPSRSSVGDYKPPRLSPPNYSMRQPQTTAVVRPTYPSTYDFESGSDSDLPDFKHLTTTRRKTGLPYGSLSSYRSRLSNPNSGSLFSSPLDTVSSGFRNYNKKDSKPFLSSFVNRFSRKSGVSDAVNPSDIKESDVEEDGFTDKWRNVNIASRNFNFRDWAKPFKSVFEHFKSKDRLINTGNNSQLLSMILLGLFVLFFIWLALAYFRVSQRAGIAGKSNNHYLICSPNQEHTLERACIPKGSLRYAINLYKDLHIELQSKGLRYLCGPELYDGTKEKPYMTTEEVVNYLQHIRQDKISTIIEGVKNLKLLLLANRHWGISLVKDAFDTIEPKLQNWASGYSLEDKAVLQRDISSYIEEGVKVFFICRSMTVPWMCYFSRLLSKFVFILTVISFGALGLGGIYVLYLSFQSYRKYKQKEDEDVMKMVQKILEHVSEVAERANSGLDSNGSITSVPQDYVAVRHVHDTLIHPAKRQKKARVWEKAVKFIEENESRIRTEVQQVWGEDTCVWRWVGPTLNKSSPSSAASPQSLTSESGNDTNHLYPDLSGLKSEAKKNSVRVWQGEAFETSAGSMNSLPLSPTQCLKIRHMFKHGKDYGPNWVDKVRDAIVEKCEGAKILHLSVDSHSKEGCVYVKCASLQDAGIAYRQLHGSWFDGALVTVKYVRLERYHERFPSSVYAAEPLRPSNNLRLSLQGTTS